MFTFLEALSVKAFLVILGIAVVLCSLGTWYLTQRHYEQEMTAYVLEVTTAKVKEDTARLTQTITTLQRLKADNTASVKKHEDTKKKLDAAYGELHTLRLSIPATIPASNSDSRCSTGDDATTSRIWLLPKEVERDISALSREADAILEQARVCQEFGQSLEAAQEGLHGVR